jgi:hypothetical protein
MSLRIDLILDSGTNSFRYPCRAVYSDIVYAHSQTRHFLFGYGISIQRNLVENQYLWSHSIRAYSGLGWRYARSEKHG